MRCTIESDCVIWCLPVYNCYTQITVNFEVKMKPLLTLIVALIIAGSCAAADKTITSYVKRNGTVVGAHIKTVQDYSKLNNYRSRSGIRPKTGRFATKNFYK